MHQKYFLEYNSRCSKSQLLSIPQRSFKIMNKKCTECGLINFSTAIACKQCGSDKMIDDESYYVIDGKISFKTKLKYFGFACLAEFIAIILFLPILAMGAMRHSSNASSDTGVFGVIAFIAHFPSSILYFIFPPLAIVAPFSQIAFLSYVFYLIGEGKMIQKNRRHL